MVKQKEIERERIWGIAGYFGVLKGLTKYDDSKKVKNFQLSLTTNDICPVTIVILTGLSNIHNEGTLLAVIMSYLQHNASEIKSIKI